MKKLRALLITALIMLVLTGVVLTFLPNLREQLFGYALYHHLKVGEENDLALTLDLTRGSEILGEGVKPSDQLRGDRLQVAIRLYEKVESTGREENLRYEVREMRREKLGVGMPGVLGTEPFSLRVPARGGVISILRPDPAKNEILTDANLEQFGLLIWPMLPEHRIKTDSRNWSGSYTFKTSILGEELELTHRLSGKLLNIEPHNGKDYAVIEFEGYIDATPTRGEMKVTGQGKVLGKAMIDLETGRNVLGAYNLTQDYLLELKGARYRWFENQDLKFFQGQTPLGAVPSPGQ